MNNMNNTSKSQIILDQSYFQEHQKYKKKASLYVPTSYGRQYNSYHDNEVNKPFTQQKGDYLYDLYPKMSQDPNPVQFKTPQQNPQKTFFRSGLDQSSYIDFQDQSILNDTVLNRSYITQQDTNRKTNTTMFHKNNSTATFNKNNSTIFNKNNYNTFLLSSNPRQTKRNILTEHALQHPSVFNTIAKESIFTNISYQANKDYDQSYDSREGFNFKLDCIELSFPATQIKSLQLSYSIVDRETETTFLSEYKAKELFYKDIFKTKQMINYNTNVPNFLINDDYYLIIRADYELFDIENRIVSFFETFTIIPIFKNKKLNAGRHKLKFLEYSSRTHPIKQTKGYSFPAADHLDCYIRICRPNSRLNISEFKPKTKRGESLPQFKEDLTTLRIERHDIDGFWAQKLKKQQEEQQQQNMEYYNQHRVYQKPSNKPNKFNIANDSRDLVKPSRYAGFLTSQPRKLIKAEIQGGKLKIDRYV